MNANKMYAVLLIFVSCLLWQCAGGTKENAGLRYENVFPETVLSSRLAQSPDLCLTPEGGAQILAERGEGYILLDFGKEMAARITVRTECQNPANESRLALYYGETPEEALRTEPYSACDWYRIPYDEFTLKGGKESFTCHGRRGLRYLCIRARHTDLKILSVVAAAEGYPVIPKGYFASDNDRLNQIWQMCANTVRNCMQEYYEDGIKRDGLLWISDYRSSFLASWFAFGDKELAKKSLRMMAASQNEDGSIAACCSKGGGHRHPYDIAYMPGIPHGSVDRWILLNYCAEYVSSVHDYIMLTGDTEIAAELEGSIKRMTTFLWGLLDFDRPGYFWTDEHRSAPSPEPYYELYHDVTTDQQSTGSKGAFLFQLLTALQEAHDMSKYMSDPDFAALTKEYGNALRKHIDTYYYDLTSRTYLDMPGQNPDSASIFPTVYGVLAGAIKEKQQLLNGAQGNSGFSAVWVLESLFRNGYDSDAFMQTEKQWGKMLDYGSGTCWERMDSKEFNIVNNQNAPSSFCHAWTAGPAWQLPVHIAGVRCLQPGFAETEIIPDLKMLNWVECTVPTAFGELFVRVEKNRDKHIATVKVPPGIKKCRLVINGNEYFLESGKLHIVD